ncbi:MAG: hypothetical protein ACI8ZN_000739 [Bacteroidia bacterium]|jgi:hypothetical protein
MTDLAKNGISDARKRNELIQKNESIHKKEQKEGIHQDVALI